MGDKKKISFGPTDVAIKDVGMLYSLCFDHSVFIEAETKSFLKEFETKRGDRDIQALRTSAELMGATNTHVDAAVMVCNRNLDDSIQKVQDLSSVIKLQLPKEALHQDQRELIRHSKSLQEEEERKKIEEQHSQERQTIENLFF